MFFNSVEYIFIFLPVVLMVYFTLNRFKLIQVSKIWLIIASVYFYACFNIKYTPYYIGFILLNYCFYTLIQKNRENQLGKNVLITAIILNLLLLVGCKYCNFFVRSINSVFQTGFPFIKYVMPMAISFQVLQIIVFLTDSYKDEKIKYGFWDFFLFMVFFPQLIVGPVIKWSETLPQFNKIRNKIFNNKNFVRGLSIFLFGFFKKGFLVDVVFGIDNLSTMNNFINGLIPSVQFMSSPEAWLFCLMEIVYIYISISAYTDMAIGSAMMLNINLPINFNNPFQSTSIADFWERWNITFANFMKNNVYYPLYNLRNSNLYNDFIIMFTCIAGGLWIGAGNSLFSVIYGGVHGLGFVIYKYWKKTNIKIPSFFSWFITLFYVSLAGVFLRFTHLSLSDIGQFCKNLIAFKPFTYNGISGSNILLSCGSNQTEWCIPYLILCLLFLIISAFRIQIEAKPIVEKFVKPNFIWAFIIAFAIIQVMYFLLPGQDFRYYDF